MDFWGQHPWNWLSAIDYTSPDEEWPEGKPLIWTKDEGSEDRPLKPWPAERDRPYLRRYIEDLHSSGNKFIFVDKPRQIMATWATVLYADWQCRFMAVRRWMLSKSTEDEAKEILRDKPRFVHMLLQPWVQRSIPQEPRPEIRVFYPNTGSYILAVAENVAQREARGGTSSGVIIDEAARQRLLPDIMQAVTPMATRVIAITTAEKGNPGAEYFKTIIDEGL